MGHARARRSKLAACMNWRCWSCCKCVRGDVDDGVVVLDIIEVLVVVVLLLVLLGVDVLTRLI